MLPAATLSFGCYWKLYYLRFLKAVSATINRLHNSVFILRPRNFLVRFSRKPKFYIQKRYSLSKLFLQQYWKQNIAARGKDSFPQFYRQNSYRRDVDLFQLSILNRVLAASVVKYVYREETWADNFPIPSARLCNPGKCSGHVSYKMSAKNGRFQILRILEWLFVFFEHDTSICQRGLPKSHFIY